MSTSNVFTHLEEVIEAANEDDTVVILPPDNSDEEDINDEEDEEEQEISEVARMLEVLTGDGIEANPDCLAPEKWSRKTKLQTMPAHLRLPTLAESHPLLDRLSPLQLFYLFYNSEMAHSQITELDAFPAMSFQS